MKFFFTFFIFFSAAFSVYSNNWQNAKRLPTDKEINQARQDFIADYKNTYGNQFDNFKFSEPIKLYHHDLLMNGKNDYEVSDVLIIVCMVNKTCRVARIVDVFNNGKINWKFTGHQNAGGFLYGGISNAIPFQGTLEQGVSYEINAIKNSTGLRLGFPKSKNSSISQNNKNESSSDSIPWEVVIGGSIVAAVATIIRKILKKGASSKISKSTKNKRNEKDENEDEDEEDAHYILQLNKNNFQLKLNELETLEVQVWKVTAKGEKKYPANIQIQCLEKALKVLPNSGTGSLKAQLLLQEMPKNQNFSITVLAQANRHQFQKQVQITTIGQKNLVIETADNKKSLRPNTFQVLTCFAKITDEKGNTISDLTNKIKFEPKSDWIDLSHPSFVEDSALIYIGCSSPNPNQNMTPPKTVVVSIYMVDVPDGDEPFKQDLEISLVDCKLETQLESATFPQIDGTSEVTFWARVENTDQEKGWNFSGEYRIGIDPSNPLTDISIEKKSETEANITLRGPIVKLDQSDTHISKTLVISAWQDNEKPLERHLRIIVSREGLFIKRGVNKNNEINFTADKPFEENIEFALNVYDEKTNQIIVDSNALQNLNFELVSDNDKVKNIASVLKPEFIFEDLITNIPYGKYQFKTYEDIPGTGEIFSLKYKITAPVHTNTDPNIFEQFLTVNVKSYGIGEEFPDWVQAYNQCKYVLDNYVPKGEPYNKLSDLLERRKMILGAEGLTVLRKKIWEVATELILAEGAKGYKSEERWANAITVTLEWTEWAGDLAFNALAAFYLKGLGATATGMIKANIIQAINFYIYEPEKGWDVFVDRQYKKIIPLLMDVAKGRLLSIENIELVVKNNKALAWTIFISCEFLYNLYQTKSVVEAAKITAQQLRDELIMRKLTAQLQKNALKYNIKIITPDEVLNDLVKSIKVVNGEDIVDSSKLLEIMRDPAKVRTIKNHGTEYMKKVFENSRQKIYDKHDSALKKYISDTYKMNADDIKIDEFRTPGTDGNTNLNTDRDYRVLRKVKTANGDSVWIELQTPNWKQKSYEIFGEVTGKPFGVDSVEWAERHQQRGTDRFDVEASKDYADNVFNENTGEIKRNEPNIKKVIDGKGTLIDSEGLGKMYETKVKNALDPGTIPEAYAQAKKGVHTLEEVYKSYKNQGLDVPEIPDKLKKAMDIVQKAKVDVDANPDYLENLNKKLNDLNYKNLGDVANDLSKSFKNLKQFDKNDSWNVIH